VQNLRLSLPNAAAPLDVSLLVFFALRLTVLHRRVVDSGYSASQLLFLYFRGWPLRIIARRATGGTTVLPTAALLNIAIHYQ
jgi:hypothetical protein